MSHAYRGDRAQSSFRSFHQPTTILKSVDCHDVVPGKLRPRLSPCSGRPAFYEVCPDRLYRVHALQWLSDAGLIYQIDLVANPEIPLSGFADKTYFKVYMSDTGLLRARSRISPETILEERFNFVRYKGAFAENYVCNELIAAGKEPFFWRSGNAAELDFLFDGKNTIVPVEVKAADNVQAKSYRLFCRKYRPETGFKLSQKNIAKNMCEETRTINLPLYLTWNINRYL